ncbi:uncharacterized protein LOC120679499 [Panicum virgatum]|uniref:Legume lectin domain-containing protein n=1 Tax=Panicum virgatum TaxID=38727 RepID=A0A8T0R093_PANVG|nr:uncharacterized protein LOC120679499 [Panicum virgatum]KAG2578569.1 hypothetical protein PVAP13_6NG202300 [Panicum virgatum]KAG2578570.1 hypothetical protein PVAP13_6NG202300 [Panicum virgatum]
MGGEMPAPLLLPFLLLLLVAPAPAPSAAAAASSFTLNFFPAAAAQLALSGGANATAAAVSMASPGARVQYRTPIVFPSATGGLAFSTYFAFALAPSAASSLAFFLTPSAAARSPPALAVVFSARQVRVDLAGRAVLRGQARYSPARSRTRSLHAWIDYNATSATLHVRLTATRVHPSPPLLSCPLDLSPVLRSGPVLAGFRTPSGNCTLFSWAFHAAPYRMHSQPFNPTDLLTTPAPPPPPERRYSPWGAAVSLLFAAACGAMVTFFVLFLWYSVAARRPVAPVEYPMHTSDVVYQKIVLVGVKDDAATADDDGHPPPGVASE